MLLAYFWLLFVGLVYSSPTIPLPDELINLSISTRNSSQYQLPQGAVEAVSYTLELGLALDIFETNTFDGNCILQFINLQNTNQVLLHANELDFIEIRLTDTFGNEINLTNTDFVANNQTDILTLTTARQLNANTTYFIHFEYRARLRTEIMKRGFFKSSYVDQNGQTRYLAATQFQPVYARRVFPCFDEPSYRAVFNIIIRHPSEYTALGNTVKLSFPDSTDDNFTITTFATTPSMPTYLVVFVVSDLTCTRAPEDIEPGVPHSICSRIEASITRELANDCGPKLTWSMESFTGVAYSASMITKIDQIALPDFLLGAMENWGLATYSENLLLWDPEQSSNRYRQYVYTVIAHEVAHFWFGNLVTCHWWSDTFLNEGFASYFEFYAPYDVEPQLETDKQFVLEQLQPALASDAAQNSAPLSSDAYTQAEIHGRFSLISYSKGGSIFRMVQHFMGLELFKVGINKYTTDNLFQSVRPTQVWEALQPSAASVLPNGLNLETVMANWVNRGGYPVLKVTRNGTDVTVTQNRFLSDVTLTPDPEDVWYVPVSYTTSTETNKFEDTSARFWVLPTESVTLPQALVDEEDWIILNNLQTGYYRVDYDTTLWTNIKTALNQPAFDGIHELNRAQIVDDYWNFARYGYKSLTQLLDLYQFLEKETSYYPWYSAFSAFNNILMRLSNQKMRTLLSSRILELSEAFYNSVPFNDAKDEDHIYTLRRALVGRWTCQLGLQDCVDNAVTAFVNYYNTMIKPDKNLKPVIYCTGLRHSTDITNHFNFLWSEYQATKLLEDQVNILQALGCIKDENVLKILLNKTISATEGIHSFDIDYYLLPALVDGNPENVNIALDWFIQYYREFDEKLGTLTSQINTIVSRFTRSEQFDKLREFIQEAEITSEQIATINSIIDGAVGNLEYTARFEDELGLLFESLASVSDCLRISSTAIGVTILGFFTSFLIK